MSDRKKFNYRWNLKDQNFTKDKGKVFSCFSCGGGSTMGYKLAGFDVIGCNEIDKRMMDCYENNHHPRFPFLESIVDFKKREDLPIELYHLDILDGSPPCSSFSIAGERERGWGKEKKFREGQANQVLDTLFFDFIDLAKKLQPKIVISENVKGLLLGNSIEYVKKIYKQFDEAGYSTRHYLLDSSKMGIPQKRERVFFISIRKDLLSMVGKWISIIEYNHNLELKFNEKEIPFSEIYDGMGKPITEHKMQAWVHRKPTDSGVSDSKKRAGMKPSDFNHVYLFKDKVMPTITGKGSQSMSLYDEPIMPSDTEIMLGGSYPLDYDFRKSNPSYLVGMSVPPVMTAMIAQELLIQWPHLFNSFSIFD